MTVNVPMQRNAPGSLNLLIADCSGLNSAMVKVIKHKIRILWTRRPRFHFYGCTKSKKKKKKCNDHVEHIQSKLDTL